MHSPSGRSSRFGARLLDPNRCEFRLWAPDVDTLGLIVDEDPPRPMPSAGDGWFELTCRASAGSRYCFELPGGLRVPDPASRLQDGGVHGRSVVVDDHGYAWRYPEWRGRPWEETVLYELHPGAFGGFDGIARRLPELMDLGITAIELMPIAAFPGERNWGYDGVLPYAPAAAYGTPDRLRRLIDAAHGLGLMVFLDVVYNHFGPDGNYLHTYARSFFRSDLQTGWGPAIDFRKPPVREFFIDNALYWLEAFRFDGLRFDAVHAIPDRDFLEELAERVHAQLRDRHVHLVLENDDNAATLLRRHYVAQWNDDGHHVLHTLLTGENDGYYEDYADAPAERLARCLAEGFVYQGEYSPHRGRARGEPSAALPPAAFVLFLQNHDQIGNRAFGERLTTLAGAEALRAASGLLLLCPQIPMLFMGEEWGAREPFLYFTDHHGELAAAVREGRRREFGRFASFSDAAAIPDPNAESTFRASIPRYDPADDRQRETLAFFRSLLGLRRAELMPRLPGTRAAAASVLGPAAVCARWRLGDGSRLLLYGNLAAQAVDAPAAAGRLLFETAPGQGGALRSGRLPGHCTLAWLEPAA